MRNHLLVTPVASIIVPCFNEDAVLADTAEQLTTVLSELIVNNKLDQTSFIYFVDDGSKDNTWHLIEEMHSKNPMVKGLKLAHNAGHQSALLAGMLALKDKVDCIISVDADLQDDISTIEPMLDEYLKGCDVVFGVRKNRDTDTFFKKASANVFYKLMTTMGVDIVDNHADYRLLSRKALNALSEFKERNLFLRGIVPQLGFKTSTIYYNRLIRKAGVSKYNIRRMLSFAFDGITSFSIVPLRMITALGFIVSLFSLATSLWVLAAFLFGLTVPGWTSTVLPIYFIGGVQLLSIGLIGEYIGKIYNEVKARPRYIIEEELF